MESIPLDRLIEQAAEAGAMLRARGWRMASAESCTGGLVSALITEIAGSSDWFERGFVTYSNEAKIEMLDVRPDTLAKHGAVSEATVLEMVAGALARSRADVAVAISGIAGPSGGTAQKPVGTVCLAWGSRSAPGVAVTHHYAGDRQAVRRQAARNALLGLCARAE
ncbi:CinA family protein [Uliginosibacterium sp. sgz301328]|uniref:CinA family protein n=1 Tax=Uliginosibacterium sp. sgz301328 TaxID=3243764 RepID=UPI00359D46F1